MKNIKRIFILALTVMTVFSLCSCSGKKKGPQEPDTSSYIINDVPLKARDGEMLIEDGRNYYVLTFESDRVKNTSYALHFLDPDAAKQVYDAYVKDLGSLYTDVRLDDTYLILTYSDENENSLNGLSRELIEQTYSGSIVE